MTTRVTDVCHCQKTMSRDKASWGNSYDETLLLQHSSNQFDKVHAQNSTIWVFAKNSVTFPQTPMIFRMNDNLSQKFCWNIFIQVHIPTLSADKMPSCRGLFRRKKVVPPREISEMEMVSLSAVRWNFTSPPLLRDILSDSWILDAIHTSIFRTGNQLLPMLI